MDSLGRSTTVCAIFATRSIVISGFARDFTRFPRRYSLALGHACQNVLTPAAKRPLRASTLVECRQAYVRCWSCLFLLASFIDDPRNEFPSLRCHWSCIRARCSCRCAGGVSAGRRRRSRHSKPFWRDSGFMCRGRKTPAAHSARITGAVSLRRGRLCALSVCGPLMFVRGSVCRQRSSVPDVPDRRPASRTAAPSGPPRRAPVRLRG